MKKKYWV
ncbi:Protein of unknown function [Bacillus wiedmannii]|nr:Protein of unknown function [Bacillus wiedmannii]SCN05808.1 Protein of unknown function [Bacillus wiedmannii]